MDKPGQNIRSPLKFLDPYSREDGDQFFGREEEINRLYESVNKNRLVLVYGQSGTGKTSLVQCGLSNRFEVTDWVPFFVRRGQDINASLFAALAESKALGGREVKADNVLSSLNRISTRYLRPVYLIFDQFEELLILGDENTTKEQGGEVEQFLELVRNILDSEQTQSVHLLFILREEYFAALDRFEQAIPQFTQRRLRVEPMRPKKLETVILENCDFFNIKLKQGPKNAQQILENLKIKGGIPLPYLQVYLDMLWREDYQRTYPNGWEGKGHPPLEFTSQEIEDFGVIRDVLDRFLSEQSTRIQTKLQGEYPELEADTLIKILDAFTTSEGTKLPVYFQLEDGALVLEQRAPSYLRNLPAGPLQAGLDELENSRILRKDDDSYELAHDTLAEIVDKRRTDEQRRRNRLRRLVRSNFELNQPLTLGHLAELEEDLDKLDLDPEQAAFVEKSRQQRAEEQRAILKKARRRQSLGTFFAMWGLFLFIFALMQFGKAREKSREAEANLELAKTARADANDKAAEAETNLIAANEAKVEAKINDERALKNKRSADSLTVIAQDLKQEALQLKRLAEMEQMRGRNAIENAYRARSALDQASRSFFDATNKAVDDYVYQLEYEKALAQLRLAASIRGRDQNLSRRFMEMAFFYNEIGQMELAIGLADTTFQLQSNWQLQRALDTIANRNALNDLLQTSDPAHFAFLQKRYYPEMVDVKGGEFQMGSEENEQGRSRYEQLHTVKVSDFQMAKTETTVWQFYLFAQAIGLDKPVEVIWGWNGDFPMHGASWYDAVAYGQWVSRQQGLPEAYSLDDIPANPNAWNEKERSSWASILDLESPGYRLPTEAEWEYAAKGGIHQDTFIYSGSSEIDTVAWYTDNSDRKAHKVGGWKANKLGLYDMSGNLLEWCWDWYDHGYYEQSDNSIDPPGPVEGSDRVHRGGGWFYYPGFCRAAYRSHDIPTGRNRSIGFRLALSSR